ncbi:hypothetical protein GCM10023155_12840 [Bremerella cremea]
MTEIGDAGRIPRLPGFENVDVDPKIVVVAIAVGAVASPLEFPGVRGRDEPNAFAQGSVRLCSEDFTAARVGVEANTADRKDWEA